MNIASGKPGGALEELLQLVSFSLGEEEFAVDILKIQEIIRMADITAVPNSPGFVEGVINLRGKVIPVIDLRKRLGLTEGKRNNNTRIVVIAIKRSVVGFIVDSVSSVLRMPSSRVEPPPPMIAGIGSEYITGVGKLDDRLLILLDADKVLGSPEIEMLEEGRNIKEKGIKVEAGESGKVEKVMEYRGMQGMVAVKKEIDDKLDEMSRGECIPAEDIRKLADHIKSLLEGNLVQEDLELYGELGELAKFINETKKGQKL